MKNLLSIAILSLIIFYSCVSVRFPETIKVDITIPSDFDIDKMQILIDTLKGLNKKMKDAASNLEFEEAAKIRDEIRKLEATELEITLNPKIRQYDVKNRLYPKGRSTLGMPGTKVKKKRDKKWKPKR